MSCESSRVCAGVGFMVSQVVGPLASEASSRKYKQSPSFFYSFYPLSLCQFLPFLPLHMPPLIFPPFLCLLSSPSYLLWFSYSFLDFSSAFLVFFFSSRSLPFISPPDLPLPHSYFFITSAIFPNPSPPFPLTPCKEQSCLQLPWKHLSGVAAFSWLSLALDQ